MLDKVITEENTAIKRVTNATMCPLFETLCATMRVNNTT